MFAVEVMQDARPGIAGTRDASVYSIGGAMRKLVLTVPEVAFIAATRGVLGIGVGLLLSGKFSESRRRQLGLSLLAFGIATTIPAARKLFGRRTQIAIAS